MHEYEYFKRSTAEVAQFVSNLKDAARVRDEKGRVTLDSASANAFVDESLHRAESEVPAALQVVLDEAGKDSRKITRAVLDGIDAYEAAHGAEAPADLVEYAMHCAYSTTDAARSKYALDSANSLQHDPLSLQPNRAVVAIIAAFSEAIPFALYLPADIGSNKAKLAILTHNAGLVSGLYTQGASLDGVQSGNAYLSSSRIDTKMPDGSGQTTGKITHVQVQALPTGPLTTDATAGDTKLLRGRTLVYVNGILAGGETSASGTGQSPINGKVKLSGTDYVIGGNIDTDTGVYTITSTPNLPTSIPVVVEGFLDYERNPAITPSIISNVEIFDIYAKPWRAFTQQSPDARTQMSNELGLDPLSESVIAIQAQFANERHYEAIAKLKRVAANNQVDYDFEWSQRNTDMTRAELWHDFAVAVGAVSQQMAVDTINHGVTHLYVGKNIAAQFRGLPNTIFEPSGVPERPFITRIGRLFGQYEVYYTPKGLTEVSDDSAQILAVGRATDVTRNPLVLGDAVPPTLVQLAVGTDLKAGTGFYARNFTELNPHQPSSMGAALINVTHLNS